MLAVSAAPSFSWVAKRPHVRDKKVLDEAVKAVLSKPQMGDEKKGTCLACLSTSSNSTTKRPCWPANSGHAKMRPPKSCCWQSGRMRIFMPLCNGDGAWNAPHTRACNACRSVSAWARGQTAPATPATVNTAGWQPVLFRALPWRWPCHQRPARATTIHRSDRNNGTA